MRKHYFSLLLTALISTGLTQILSVSDAYAQCSNVTNAGSIGNVQSGCSPFDPAAITSVSLPSGGSGTLQYVWLQSFDGGNNFSVISGASSSTYNPPALTQDRWFKKMF